MSVEASVLDGRLGMVGCGEVVLRLNKNEVVSLRVGAVNCGHCDTFVLSRVQVTDMSCMRIVEVLKGVALLFEEEEDALGNCRFEAQKMLRGGEGYHEKHRYMESSLV